MSDGEKQPVESAYHDIILKMADSQNYQAGGLHLMPGFQILPGV